MLDTTTTPRILTVAQAAELLQVSTKTLYTLIFSRISGQR